MAARTVVGIMEFPVGSGAPCVGARVSAELYADGNVAYGTVGDRPIGSTAVLTDNTGGWALTLESNASITPAGTVWLVTEKPPDRAASSYYISVPDSVGPHDVNDLLTEQPGALPTQALVEHAALTATHGVSGAVVGTANTQTLTNKTLTDPTITYSTAALKLAARTAANTARAMVVHVDDYASPQAAIDSLGGARGYVDFGVGDYNLTSSLDAKRAHLRGVGAAGNSGGGGTRLNFSSTYGIYSSVNDNYGFRLSWLDIIGSAGAAPSTDNGQVLVNFAGQNYPRMENCRIRQAGTGLRLDKSGSVECHYGTFVANDFNDCYVALDAKSSGSAASAGTHTFVGGRWTACKTGALIADGSDCLLFSGVNFECGSGNTAVDSTGTNISFVGCRWETLGSNLVVRSGAGSHFVFGGHWSSGADIVDENIPSVVYGFGGSVVDGVPLAASHPYNLVVNGGFEYDTNADGLADGWTETFSSGGTGYSSSLDAGEAQSGSYAQKIVTGTRLNARIYQTLSCAPGVPHVVSLRYKVDSGGNPVNVRVGQSTTGTEYANVLLTADGTWRELRYAFTPGIASPVLVIYFAGSTSTTAYFDAVSVTAGISAPGVLAPKPITEAGGTVYGNIGFYGAAPAAKPTGVAVSAAGIHAALVTLGLISA